MSSLFGALGSLAESYGLARQQLQENALAQIRERTEQRYADIAEQRLAEEREQLKQQQQESAFRQKEFEFRQKQYQNNFIDLGTPVYTDPVTKQRMKRLFNIQTGEHKDFGVPGTGNITPEKIKEYISGARKEDQPELTRLADIEVQRNPDDPGKAFDAVEARRKQLEDAAAKAGNKKGSTKVEALGGLRALKTSVTQLESRLGVLDDFWGGLGMAAAGVGQRAKTGQGLITGALGGVATRLGYSAMSDDQKEYIRQLNVAIGQIPVMRNYFGMGSRAQAAMDNLARDLPDPQTTPSSYDGRRKLALVQQEIKIIEDTLAQEAAGAGASATPGTAPNVNDLLTPDVLNKLFGAR